MAVPASKNFSEPKTYAELRRGVESALLTGRRNIDHAWVRTYWETGRLINEHILLNKERAEYGAQVFARLAADLKISKRALYECAQFARCFPIVRDRAQLTWNHYRLLCQVADAARRKTLTTEAIRLGWTSPQLETRVRALATQTAVAVGKADTSELVEVAPPRLLTPKRGTPGVCKVIPVGDGLVVDLGFACYLDLALRPGSGQAEDSGFTAGSFVQMDAAGRITVAPGAGKADLFTYAAVILKVVDGDTLWVRIYLRPRQWVKQKLRLRDLDAPELSTPEGKAAKRFVDGLLPEGTAVTVCTTKPDKYDRYLADVFVAEGAGEPVFVNNALLAAGHAVTKREWEFGDWGEA
jgi:endonuclease YncB( thermonuclease family)